jgi:hypothetical protein
MTGWHCITLLNTVLDAGLYSSAYWAQWDNIRLIEGPKSIQAEIGLAPDTIHVHCPGKWIVCFIEFPAGYDVNDIDEATVTLQNIPAYLGKEGLGRLACHKDKIADHDGDGIPERIVRFDQDAVRAIVPPPGATLTVKGTLVDKTPFEGSATIKVVDKLAELKAKLEELKAKAQDLKDKHKDDKKGCGDVKNIRDKFTDIRDQCRDKDDKGAKKR